MDQSTGKLDLWPELIEVAPVTVAAAKLFIAAHHRHLKKVTGGLFAAGVVDGRGALRAVAMAGVGPRVWNDSRRIIISRVASDGTKNACSMLYGALCRAARALGYKEAWTYTLESEPGTSLRASGFEYMGLGEGGSFDCPSRARSPDYDLAPKLRWRRKL